MPNFPRISARLGNVVDLNVSFFKGGVLADPYAIRKVEIYRSEIAPHNLVATIPVVDVASNVYPSPVSREYVNTTTGDCGTEPTASTEAVVGKYHLLYSIPTDFSSPNVYFDLWYYYAENPCGELGTDNVTDCDIDDADYADFLLKCCHRFWVYPNQWFCDDGLQTVNFGFEPLNNKFNSPEKRYLEVGLMPLPLYDYNFNLVNPLIPFLSGYITIETQHCELLVDKAAMSIALRQGSYRTNPYVFKYLLDTSKFYKGTYKYHITLELPDGTTRVSNKFYFSIF